MTFTFSNNARPTRKTRLTRPAPRIRRPIIPRRPGPALSTRGPQSLVKKPQRSDAPGPKPTSFVISDAEWQVYWWLSRRKIRFEFQSSLLGGRFDKGGLVVDFLLPDYFSPGLVLSPGGEYWHYYTTEQRAKNLMDKLRLQAAPYNHTVVQIREDDIYRSLDWVMTNALQGRQVYDDRI